MYSGEDGIGMRILAQALKEPMRILVQNAGLQAEPLLHEALTRGAGWSFDVLQQQFVNTLSDPLSVTAAALQASVSAASSALTSDVLIARTS
jgi:chaperonin GroEL (HSP60 family)